MIRVAKLAKTYRTGFWYRRKDALFDVSFDVAEGESFGFLGANGAGKSTTIRVLLGLTLPTSGSAEILGRTVADAAVREVVGYLPEQPQYPPRWPGREYLLAHARLRGLRGPAATKRCDDLLEKVGLARDAARPIGGYSKGMTQRLGLAAALVARPALLILDEPMSGLDPVGRREMRELILEQRAHGMTVFFSSHVLSDVEAVAGRVAIIHKGRLVRTATAAEFLTAGAARGHEVHVATLPEALRDALNGRGVTIAAEADGLALRVPPEPGLGAVLEDLRQAGVIPHRIEMPRRTLEDLFFETIGATNSEARPA